MHSSLLRLNLMVILRRLSDFLCPIFTLRITLRLNANSRLKGTSLRRLNHGTSLCLDLMTLILSAHANTSLTEASLSTLSRLLKSALLLSTSAVFLSLELFSLTGMKPAQALSTTLPASFRQDKNALTASILTSMKRTRELRNTRRPALNVIPSCVMPLWA